MDDAHKRILDAARSLIDQAKEEPAYQAEADQKHQTAKMAFANLMAKRFTAHISNERDDEHAYFAAMLAMAFDMRSLTRETLVVLCGYLAIILGDEIVAKYDHNVDKLEEALNSPTDPVFAHFRIDKGMPLDPFDDHGVSTS